MNRHKLILSASVVIGFAVSVVFFFYITSLRKQTDKDEPIGIMKLVQPKKAKRDNQVTYTTWVKARKDIPFRRLITANDLEVVEVASDMMEEGAVSRMDDAIGKFSVAPVMKGQYLLASNLKEPVAGSDLGFVLPEGMRAITIETSVVSGVGQMLKPDDMVDVIVYLDDKTSDVPISFVLFQKLRVLATDQVMRNKEPEKDKKGKTPISKITKETPYTSVTLAATPEQCVKLHLAEEIGEMRMVLRSPDYDSYDYSYVYNKPTHITFPNNLAGQKKSAPKKAAYTHNSAPAPDPLPGYNPALQPGTPPWGTIPVSAEPRKEEPIAPQWKGPRVTVIRGMDVSVENVSNFSAGD